MATLNPLEQKARASFIKGFVIALLIGLLVSAGLGVLYFQKLNEEKQRKAKEKTVIVAKQEIESGTELTSDLFTTAKADQSVAPQNAPTSFAQLVSSFQSEGSEEEVSLVAKVSLNPNTIITTDLVDPSDEETTDDMRMEQYNMVILPVDLKEGETVDIRLRLPSGQDYVVLSKKSVKIPLIAGIPSTDTIQIKVKESEILTMSAAIVDAYKITGSKLYAVKYSDPGMQNKSVATYIPADTTLNLIAQDQNIVLEAKNSLVSFYNNNWNAYRTGVENAINKIDSETQKTNIESGTATETSTQKSQRQQFLQDVE